MDGSSGSGYVSFSAFFRSFILWEASYFLKLLFLRCKGFFSPQKSRPWGLIIVLTVYVWGYHWHDSPIYLGQEGFWSSVLNESDSLDVSSSLQDKEAKNVEKTDSSKSEETSDNIKNDEESYKKENTVYPPTQTTLVLQKNQSLSQLLQAFHLPSSQIFAIIQALETVCSLKKLSVGQRFYIQYKPASQTRSTPSLQSLTFQKNTHTSYQVKYQEGRYVSSKKNRVLQKNIRKITGVIGKSFFQDAIQQGADPQMISHMIKIFSYDVNFQLDLRPQDAFTLWYEEWYDEETGETKPCALLYGRLTLSGRLYRFYRHQSQDGSEDFYNEKGFSHRKSLLQTPIPGARLSSFFGVRRHPILGFTKFHKGVDFAAPEGTPIMVAGDGIIEKLGSFGSYGKYIRVRHYNTGYKTAYAHLSRFGKFRQGSPLRQGQIIGYVGSTGRSTAPHLHYEVHHHNRPINPKKMTQGIQHTLQGAELTRFKRTLAKIKDTP